MGSEPGAQPLALVQRHQPMGLVPIQATPIAQQSVTGAAEHGDRQGQRHQGGQAAVGAAQRDQQGVGNRHGTTRSSKNVLIT